MEIINNTLNIKPVIFIGNNKSSIWLHGWRSEPIKIGNVSFYYKVNKKTRDADFMIMRTINSIHSIDKVDLKNASTIDNIINTLQLHLNSWVNQFFIRG